MIKQALLTAACNNMKVINLNLLTKWSEILTSFNFLPTGLRRIQANECFSGDGFCFEFCYPDFLVYLTIYDNGEIELKWANRKSSDEKEILELIKNNSCFSERMRYIDTKPHLAAKIENSKR